jgi:hypothetical protein
VSAKATEKVAPGQRFTRTRPCPICGGYHSLPQGEGVRCAGYLSSDGEYAHCTREEYAGDIEPSAAIVPTYAHRLHGPCRCGNTHGDGASDADPKATGKKARPRRSVGEPMRFYAVDESGTTLGVHVRQEFIYTDTNEPGKDMRWERHAGRSSNDMPLWNTPAAAVVADTDVWLCEGEKKAKRLQDELQEAGWADVVLATMTGAGGMPCDDSLRILLGRRVTFWPDNDADGKPHMRKIAQRLLALGADRAQLRWVDWPDAPPKADAWDYFAGGGTVDGLAAMVKPFPAQQEESAGESGDSHNKSRDAQWDEPVPLPGNKPAVAPFDMELLPAALRGWIWDVAERMQCPPDFPSVGAMVSLAAVVGRQIGIHPKRYDDWLVVPNLWGALVGHPSSMKTPALEAGLKPLDRLVAEAAADYERDMAQYEAKVRIYKALLAAHETDLKRAAKDGDEDEVARIAATPPEKPTPSVKRRYSTNDATVEKIGELLIENPNGLLQFRDELVGWLRRMDQPGHETDRAFFLEGFSVPKRGFEVDRIGRGSLYVPALCLSLLGGIQPGPLASYVYDAASPDSAGNDGLLQRFQLLVWPDDRTTYRNVDRYANTEAKNTAYAVYKCLANLDVSRLGATRLDDEPGTIPALRFTADAQEVWDEWDEWHERLMLRLLPHKMSAPLEAHLGKYPKLMSSLALLSHLADVEEGDTCGVGVEAAVRAIAWCEYLESHANRLYAHTESPGLERARALLEHIEAGDVIDGTSAYAILRHHWSRLKTPDEVNDAIKMLEVYGWARLERVSNGQGRPSDVIRVHPSIASAQTQRAA